MLNNFKKEQEQTSANHEYTVFAIHVHGWAKKFTVCCNNVLGKLAEVVNNSRNKVHRNLRPTFYPNPCKKLNSPVSGARARYLDLLVKTKFNRWHCR